MAENSNTQELKTPETMPTGEMPEANTEAPIAPEMGKTTEEPGTEGNKGTEGAKGQEGPSEEDVANVVTLLNEVQKFNGGKGEISSIPPEIFNEVKFLLDKMVALRDAFEDPLFKAVLDDMVDQKDDGKTPSVLVAIARNVPVEELQDLADNEEYEGMQEAVQDRINKAKEEKAGNEALYANFEISKKEIDDYVAENNYSEEEASALHSDIAMLRDAFADGKLTKAELAKIDKMRNYDKDIAAMKEQVPAEPKKEILPDKASMEAAMTENIKEKVKPRNSIEAMGAAYPGVDVTKVGSRKRYGG